MAFVPEVQEYCITAPITLSYLNTHIRLTALIWKSHHKSQC